MYGGTGEVRAFILEEYNILLYITIWVLIVVTFFSIYKKLKNKIIKKNTSLINQFISFLCFLVLTIILIRGGTQERPLDWGYAYFSNSNMGNLAAQNPIFFLGRSYLEMREEENYHAQFLKVDDLEQMNYDFNNLMLKYNHNDKQNNLNKLNTPNIILIILESFVAENCNYLNKNQNDRITPFLDELSQNGISFTNCFANGIRSAYGLGSILTSWPVLPGKPIISQVESSFNNNASSNAINVFSKLGYNQTFIYGGDANFDNMKGFCVANGFNEVIDQNHKYLMNLKKGTVWGYYDHDIFNSLFNIIKKQNAYPFFTTVFSTTNHEPFKIPQNYEKYFQDIETGSKKYLKAKKTMAYNDLALKEFFKKAKKEEWYYNTIFIITADHGLTVNRSLPNHPKNGHIPFIIYSDLFDSHQQIDKIVSQVDIIPTIIDILGEEKYLSHFYGVSGLKEGGGFACRMTDEVIQWINPDYIYYELIGTDQNELLSYNSIWDKTYIKVQSDIINNYKKESNIYIKNAYYRFKHNNYEGIY
jgi:phosphoglycerol transferase